MLVLSRWPGQSIMIRDDIEITVLSVTSDSVRLGIQAPRRVPVYRKELYLEIAQQRAAAGVSSIGTARSRLAHDGRSPRSRAAIADAIATAQRRRSPHRSRRKPRQ